MNWKEERKDNLRKSLILRGRKGKRLKKLKEEFIYEEEEEIGN